MTHTFFKAATRAGSAVVLTAALAGCSALPSLPFFNRDADKPKAAELQPNPSLIAVRQAWTAGIGEVNLPLQPHVLGSVVTVASSDGTVAAIDAATGRDVWRASVGGPIAAGVGSDGKVSAIVTRANELVALSAGKELWRQKLGAGSYTAPLVAGARVFVLTADRAVSAFDGQTGAKLWTQQRAGEPLVLRHAGVMLAVGDTLVVGLSGRLVGMNPMNGTSRWEVPIATPRGINDVERLVDLVGQASRIGDSVCARAFQAAVGCVDTAKGTLAWTRPANSSEGISGDDKLVFGSEWDGKVLAWRRDNGERAWLNDKMLHRGLSAPLSLGRSVVIGDATGFVHLLSREDGTLMNRLSTDGSAIAVQPVIVGNTLVVVNRSGAIYGFVPQ